MSLYKTAKAIVKTGLYIAGVGLLSYCSQNSPTAPQTNKNTDTESIEYSISTPIIYNAKITQGNKIQFIFSEKDNADSFLYRIKLDDTTTQTGGFRNNYEESPTDSNGLGRIVAEVQLNKPVNETRGNLKRRTDHDNGTQFSARADTTQ